LRKGDGLSTPAPSDDSDPQEFLGGRLAIRNDKGVLTICTPELTKEFAGYIAEGLSIQGACRLANISLSTYEDWMAWGDDPEPREPFRTFREKVQLARGRLEQRAVKAWMQGFNNHDGWRAAKELLQVRFPETYHLANKLAVERTSPMTRAGEEGLPLEERVRLTLVILAEAGALPEEVADGIRSVESSVIDAEIIEE
jgi:hypothetical protein